MPQTIKRTLDFFAKGEDELAGQFVLRDLPEGFLQRLFGLPEDDPMYEVLPVEPEELESLRPYFAGEVDPQSFDYYLDASAVTSDAMDAAVGAAATTASRG